MSTEVKTEPQPPHRAPRAYKGRVSEFVASRRGKMLGVAEVAGLTGSCIVLALVMFSYIYFLVPARSRIASLNRDREQVQTNLQKLSTVVNTEHGTQQRVDEVAASLNTFETEHLMRQDQGQLALVQELNQLIIKNALRNTSGPTYTILDSTGTKSLSGKSVVTKWQSFYPGMSVMVTVEGEYQNVRRFIQDVERSKQFVVINQVELQRAQQNNAPTSADGSSAESGTRGSLVSLQLNMATYFQRNTGSGTPVD